MPIQALITHLPKSEVKKQIAAMDGAADVLEIVDHEGAQCLLRSTLHDEAPDNEKSRVNDMVQKIADADSKLVREAVAKAEADSKPVREAAAIPAQDRAVTPVSSKSE